MIAAENLYSHFTTAVEGIISKYLLLLLQSNGCAFAIDNLEGFFPVMELRTHPLMSYRGRPNWPPRWVWLGGKKNERPTGEVGVLKEVSKYSLLSSDGLTLVIEYNESAYMGLLLFEDFGVCRIDSGS